MSPMTRIRSIVPILVFVAAPSAQVSPELAQLIKKEGLENSKVMDYLDHLTNKIGHRLTEREITTLNHFQNLPDNFFRLSKLLRKV